MGAGVAVITGYFLHKFVMEGEGAIEEAAKAYDPVAQYFKFGCKFHRKLVLRQDSETVERSSGTLHIANRT